MSAQPEAAVPRRVSPQNQENDFIRQNPRAYAVPGAETPEVDGVPERRVSPAGFDGTEGSAHPNSATDGATFTRAGTEIPRPRGGTVNRGEVDVRGNTGITSPLNTSELPAGGSLSVPNTPGTSYFTVRAPTGQTIYFEGANAQSNAEVYANSFGTARAATPPPPKGIIGSIEGGAAALYGGFESGASAFLGAAGGAGREVGTYIRTGKVESFSTAQQQFLNQQIIPNTGITGSQYTSFGATTIGYVVPGVAILKGVGEYNVPLGQRAFDIGVGVLGVLPIAGVGAEAGSYGARVISGLANPGVRFGVGAGISSLGTVASGNYDPTSILASGAIGGTASLLLGSIANRVLATTPPEAAVPVVNDVYSATGQDIFNFPGRGSVYGTGRLSPSGFDIQEIEGVNPVKGRGGFETEPPPPPVQPSRSVAGPAPVIDMPYSNLFDISGDIRGGSNRGFSFDTPVTQETSKYSVGAGGSSLAPPSGNVGPSQTSTFLNTPRGIPSPSQDFINDLVVRNYLRSIGSPALTNFDIESGVVIVSPVGAVSPLGRRSVNTLLGPESSVSQGTSISLNQGLTQQQISGEVITPISAVTPVTGQSQSPGQGIVPVTFTGPAFPPFGPVSEGSLPPLIAPIGLFPLGSGNQRPKSGKRFRFGEKVSAVRTVFLGGAFEFESTKKQRKK